MIRDLLGCYREMKRYQEINLYIRTKSNMHIIYYETEFRLKTCEKCESNGMRVYK